MYSHYNAQGLRIGTEESGIYYGFTFERGSIIREVDSNNELISRSIRRYSLIANKDNREVLSYYLHNSYGDITNLVDENGQILNSYDYDAFGNTLNQVEQVSNRFMYAGEQLDKVTEHYYLRARYYAPNIGRFTQEDTFRGDGLNLYAYVSNNPVMYVDPSGYCKGEVGNSSDSGFNTWNGDILIQPPTDWSIYGDVHRDISINYYDESIPEYTIIENLLDRDGNFRERKDFEGIKGIVVHWTAAPNQKAINTRQHFVNTKNASSHYILNPSGTEVLRTVPEDKTAFTSGTRDSKYYTKLVHDNFVSESGYRRVNDWTISIETNPIDKHGNFSNETYTTLVRLTADKLDEYNLDIDKGLYRHHDFTTKDCPKIFVNKDESWKKHIDPSTGKEMGVTPTYNAQWTQFKLDVLDAMNR